MSIKTLRVSSFNVRGLSSHLKRNQLSEDLKFYDVDICTIQETKCTQDFEAQYGNYHLIILESKCEHYGLGFAIKKDLWEKFKYKVWSVSDRIAVLELKVDKEIISIINVYGPTQVLCDKNKDATSCEIRDKFYCELSDTKKQTNCSRLQIIAGDFNSKIGKSQTREDCLGKFSRGRRNENGQELINFCMSERLSIVNTLFQQRQSHITTWEGQRKDQNGNIVSIYNQIDYILCKNSQKGRYTNCRSYSGTLLFSDHRLLISTINIDLKDCHRRKRNAVKKLNTNLIVTDKDSQKKYNELVEVGIQNHSADKPLISQLDDIRKLLLDSAREVVGCVESKRNVKAFSLELKALSEQQRALRYQIRATDNAEKRYELKRKRNNLLHTIKKRSLVEYENNLIEKVKEIEIHKDTAKMFKATQLLNRKPYQPPVVHDSNGKRLLGDQDIACRIQQHFEQQFFSEEDENVEPFIGNPRPLTNPISVEEVSQSVKKLNNGRAVGPDNLPSELLKYGPESLMKTISDIFNDSLSNQKPLNIGVGTLISLHKPGKPKKVENLRPVVLLSTIRKLLSLIVLDRIKNKVNSYLAPSHSGFRKGRSTSDAIWTHKFLIAHTQRLNDEFTILGIDMSKAFDTVHRQKLIHLLGDILSDDELRMVRLLLSDTKLQIKSPRSTVTEFITNRGVPQGDSLSPVLFTVYLESALRELRNKIITTNTTHNPPAFPSEIIYADDTDFICKCPALAEKICDIAPTCLQKWNLNMNPDKTENTLVSRKHKPEETWRTVKKLGSLLGCSEDIKRRKQHSWIAFNKLQKLWRRNEVSLKTKVRLYNAYVKSILTYNAGTWAITNTEEKVLDSLHRRHLRILANIRYPEKISNTNIYKKCHISKSLSSEITEARWRLFGHVLRLSDDTPAQIAMMHYFNCVSQPSDFLGRPRTTVPLRLNSDLQQAAVPEGVPSSLSSEGDFRTLKDFALNRADWKRLTRRICNAKHPGTGCDANAN